MAQATTSALSGLTASQVVVNIKILIAESQALHAPANSISVINGPLMTIGQGPFPLRPRNPIAFVPSLMLFMYESRTTRRGSTDDNLRV
jgi:hypothetical protein